MKTLSQELDRYLSIRGNLGYKLSSDERVLRKFVAFVEGEGAVHISTALFLRWKDVFGKAKQQTWPHRLTMVRVFAQWLHALDPRHEVPPASLIPNRFRRPHPYIYSEEDVRRIVEIAAELPSIHSIRALTCSTLFGLIAVTGLRVSEALSLDAADVDLESGVITLRQGKLGSSRLLPVSECTKARLDEYSKERDRLLALLRRHSSWRIVGSVSPTAGRDTTLPPSVRPSDCARCRSTTAMDAAPAREMLKLSTYLGHSRPGHTYWYIEAVPELLELASKRVEGVKS